MNPQIIYDTTGQRPEFAVIPWKEYQQLVKQDDAQTVMAFDVANYIENPIKAMRIKASTTQIELAQLMGVSQAYIGKIESASHKPTANLTARVQQAISAKADLLQNLSKD